LLERRLDDGIHLKSEGKSLPIAVSSMKEARSSSVSAIRDCANNGKGRKT
jgi:hypothetical protein